MPQGGINAVRADMSKRTWCATFLPRSEKP